MPKKKGGRRRKGQKGIDVEEETGEAMLSSKQWREVRGAENEQLLEELETLGSENPYFSYERCPRFVRLNEVARANSIAGVQQKMAETAQKNGSATPCGAKWRSAKSQRLRRGRNGWSICGS